MTATLWTNPASRIHPLLSGVALILGGILAAGPPNRKRRLRGRIRPRRRPLRTTTRFASSRRPASKLPRRSLCDGRRAPGSAVCNARPSAGSDGGRIRRLQAARRVRGCGRRGRRPVLIFHFPTLGKLGVFDVVAARITGFVSLPSGDVGYAAGAEKLIVVLRDQKVIQRWNLKTLEREVAVPVPDGEAVSSVTMGCAAEGPALLGTQDTRYSATNLRLLDPNTMQLIPHQISTTWIRESPSLGHLVRASADGRVFAAWAKPVRLPASSPSYCKATGSSPTTSTRRWAT